MLYLQYQRIAERFPGWSLTEIKAMPIYERQHWINVLLNDS